jgi:hypothetical protein
MDNTPLVEDLRTSLIAYPATGRLPALVQGVRRNPGIEDFLAIVGDLKGPPPPQLASLIASFGGGKRESYKDFPLAARCIFGASVPFLPQLSDNFLQIVQARDHIVLLTDVDRRIISLDARTASGDGPQRWSGTSRGSWDGETLVVETRNFNGRASSLDGAGNSRDKVVTERFTRTSRNVVEYSATVVDPKTFQDRVEVSFPMAQVDTQIHEGGCHEGNYSLRHALEIARMEDAAKK